MSIEDCRDVTLIVRECGERTADACVSLLAELFPGQPILRVSADPFSATLRESIVRGLAAGKPWTLCIDADVLVISTLRDFIKEAKRLPIEFCEAQALVADKLLPACRPAGNHLYRTAHLQKALDFIKADQNLRPESAMLEALGEAGYPYHQSTCIIGLHDFEQSPEDIFNKASLHGHKHVYLREVLLPLWTRWAVEDQDYEVALIALTESSTVQRPVEVSRSWLAVEAAAAMASHSLSDKLPLCSLASERIYEILGDAPHLRAEADCVRKRIEYDVLNLIKHQRQRYALAMPRWQRWLYRVLGTYPFLR